MTTAKAALPWVVYRMIPRDDVTDDISHQYIDERTTRLAEQNYLENVLGSGVDELAPDLCDN